jgi:hypothetical protein
MVFHSCKQWTAHKAAPLDVCLVTKHFRLVLCFCFAFFGLIIRSSPLLSCPSSLLSSFSLYDDYCLSFSLKVLLFSFVVLEDLKFSTTTTLVFHLVFFHLFLLVYIEMTELLLLLLSSPSSLIASCYLFRVIISSCLFVRSFVFVLVSRGRGGVLEGLGKK